MKVWQRMIITVFKAAFLKYCITGFILVFLRDFICKKSASISLVKLKYKDTVKLGCNEVGY